MGEHPCTPALRNQPRPKRRDPGSVGRYDLGFVMPKMKTNSSAKKRFKVTGSGRVRRGSAGLSHMMIGKSANRRRKLRKHAMVNDADEKRIKRLLPYG